ncbi:hypothetical protein HAX54_003055 [Datura stramonium]|uniref:Uncharacterized protein n=1 Tax=Datura stramonium TaxID=4076 RepID=A0ABS8T5H9_DATST|nr:hypothetical protein [Datura stramonium]
MSIRDKENKKVSKIGSVTTSHGMTHCINQQAILPVRQLKIGKSPRGLSDHKRSPRVMATHDDSQYEPSSVGGRISKRTVWVIVRTNGSCYYPVGSTGTMTSPVNKMQKESVARKEIAKRRGDTRTNSKAQEAAATTTSPPHSDEDSDEAESDGDNPHVDNAEKGNDDAEESGDDDTNAEESVDKDSAAEESNEQGSMAMKKGNPNCSIQEEPKIQNNSLNEFPELKRLFEGYNMYWMAKTLGKYSMEMVHEFYANYYCTLEKKDSSNKAIKKEPVLDFARGIRKLTTKDKVLHFQLMDNIIDEDKEGAEWVTGRKLIYKASLNFLAKSGGPSFNIDS